MSVPTSHRPPSCADRTGADHGDTPVQRRSDLPPFDDGARLVDKSHVIAAGVNDPIWHDPAVPRRHQRRLHWVFAAAFLVVLIGGYLVAAPALSRRDYGTFAFWSTPDRVNYCGRRYYSSTLR